MIIKDTEIDPKYQNLWKRALVSADQKNWDYVVNLLLPIVKENLGFLDGRMLLRSAEGEKVNAGGKKFGLGGLSLGGGGGLFKSTKKEPAEQIAELEENVFQKDPFNQNANLQLYDLAMKLHFPELAAFALETLRLGHPENTKHMHKLAQHYMAHEQPEKAADVYKNIAKVDPRDMDALKGEKDAAAKTSILRQGWGSEGDFRKAMKDSGEAAKLEKLAKQGMTKEEMEQFLADTIAQYEQDQTNIIIVKRMADLYEKIGQLDNALMFYDYSLQLNPGDVAMQRKVEILRDKMLDMNMAQMEADIESNPDAPDIEDKRAQIAEIKRQRAGVLIAEAKGRVERNPTDKGLRYELGQAYFNADMYTEAIPELQQARSNPHIRTKAMLLLGRCFERKNMNDLASNVLNEASKELVVMDNTKKEILYELALVNEKMGRQEAYLDALKEIYNADYGYRDVAKRVESSYS
jgi:tetratricopeptide (TPR) repeat protein